MKGTRPNRYQIARRDGSANINAVLYTSAHADGKRRLLANTTMHRLLTAEAGGARGVAQAYKRAPSPSRSDDFPFRDQSRWAPRGPTAADVHLPAAAPNGGTGTGGLRPGSRLRSFASKRTPAKERGRQWVNQST